MHIVVDARLADQRPGGIATYCRELSHALPDALGDARLTVLRHRRGRPWALPAVVRQQRVWTPAHHPWDGVTIGLEAAAARPDVYHATDTVPPAVRSWPCVATIHDLAYLRWPEILDAGGRRYYGQVHQAVWTADHLIAVSETTSRDLRDLLGVTPARVSVVPQGVAPAFLPLDCGERIALARATGARSTVAALTTGDLGPYILVVGTIEPRKNLPLLLRAYDRLVATWNAAPRLVLAGREGWLAADTWRTLAHIDARPRVIWVDGPTDSELIVLYGGARALAFPSRYEGFGLPALEAMACGVPVLATDGSALREIVDGAGWLVPGDDAGAWCDALGMIATDDALCAQLAAAGRVRADRYTWAATASATAAVYRRARAGG